MGETVCGNKVFSGVVASLNAGPRRIFLLNGGYPIVSTPNPAHWTNQEFRAFNQDPTAFCDAAVFGALRAYSDRLLWGMGCSTGNIPPQDTPSFAVFQKCVQVEKLVEDWGRAN